MARESDQKRNLEFLNVRIQGGGAIISAHLSKIRFIFLQNFKMANADGSVKQSHLHLS